MAPRHRKDKQNDDWKAYEQAVLARILADVNLPHATVKHNQKLPSKSRGERQIDILISAQLGPFEVKIVVDCKFYSRPVDVKAVEAFLGLVKDVEASKGILVSPSGYSKTAVARALRDDSDIELYVFKPGGAEPYHGTGAMPFKTPGGVAILAPPGWVIDVRSHVPNTASPVKMGETGPVGLAFLHPLGLTRDQAFHGDCFIYCNISVGTTIEDIVESQRKNHPGFEPEMLNVRQHLTYVRVASRLYLIGDTAEYTIFLDFGYFIFWSVLLVPAQNQQLRTWACQSHLLLMNSTKPFLVESLNEHETKWTPLVPTEDENSCNV